ncbi:MAG: LytTR family transcriptional regulator [Rhodobacteraceae bacterium]|nr:LytTR family transcriptional regulator [Paracoccaceae bacterium]
MLLVLGGVAIVLGMSGPFDTYSAMRPGPRLIYWTLLVFVTYATGFVTSDALFELLQKRVQGRWPRTFLSGVGAGLCVSVVLGFFNFLALENPEFPSVWIDNLVPVIAITVIVTALFESLQPNTPMAQNLSRPDLLDRLPLDKRGDLVSLSVSDHYVDVVTTKGREMLLMRLSDSIRETALTPGLQVHRSHWVALDQVTQACRTGETALVITSAGDQIPVSRTYMGKLRKSGLLPNVGPGNG